MSETVNNPEDLPSISAGMVSETKSDSHEITTACENMDSCIDPISDKPNISSDNITQQVVSVEENNPVDIQQNQEDSSVTESPGNEIDVDKTAVTTISEINVNVENIPPSSLPKRGMSDHESSDEGSEYKDAVNPTSPDDRGSFSESEDSGHSRNGDVDDEARSNRRNVNLESKDSDSDEDSEGRSDFNESEPSGTREAGDGEEKSKLKEMDRDEDKKDPQYIPKKGMFYEHDDRTCDDGSPTPVKEDIKDKKKKFVADKVDRWGHDMFDDQKQSPKSAQDLIDFYGYDIRNEEEAPKAWRSRRYGRGPNKYTRKWQDEAAYHGKRGPPTVKPPPKPFKKKEEDFPTMEESRSYPGKGRGRGRINPHQNQDRDHERIPNRNFTPHRDRPEPVKPKPSQPEPQVISIMHEQTVSLPEKFQPPKEQKAKEVLIEKSNFPAKKKAFSSKAPVLESDAEADIAALSKKFSNAVINIGRDGKILPIGGQTKDLIVEVPLERKEESVIIEAVHEVQPIRETVKEKPTKHEGKSKRYSSQRQRSLPQPSPIQQQPQQQQQFIHQQSFGFEGEAPPPIFHGAPPPVYPEGLVFLPPGYQPPAPPPPHLINYSLPPPPQQFGLPIAAPPDLFPTQPGITYYNPTQQPPPPRPNTSRKGKFAIPIISPDQVVHES